MQGGAIKHRVLLVDGDEQGLRVLDVSLKKAGFQVTTARNGAQGLDALAQGVPDLIISATRMETMDGFEMCRCIKQQAEWAKIPLLFLAAGKSIEDKIRGLELGAEDYLEKPIYMKEVITRVRMILQRQQSERVAARRDGGTTFAGQLADVGVVDLVQTIELNRKSGIVHLRNRDDKRGEIYFRDGKVIDAEVGRLSGANAVYRLFSWSDGTFEVEFKPIRRRDVIEASAQAVMMEGLRRLDEWTHMLETLPPLDTVFEVNFDLLAERLAEVPDEVNGVLRLVDGRRSLMQIIDDSDFPDLEALTILGRLYADRLVVPVERHTPPVLVTGVAPADGEGGERTTAPGRAVLSEELSTWMGGTRGLAGATPAEASGAAGAGDADVVLGARRVGFATLPGVGVSLPVAAPAVGAVIAPVAVEVGRASGALEAAAEAAVATVERTRASGKRPAVADDIVVDEAIPEDTVGAAAGARHARSTAAGDEQAVGRASSSSALPAEVAARNITDWKPGDSMSGSAMLEDLDDGRGRRAVIVVVVAAAVVAGFFGLKRAGTFTPASEPPSGAAGGTPGGVAAGRAAAESNAPAVPEREAPAALPPVELPGAVVARVAGADAASEISGAGGAAALAPKPTPVTAPAPGDADPAAREAACRAAYRNGNGRYAEVRAACGRWLAEEPRAAPALAMLAHVELDRGSAARARDLAGRAIAIDPALADAYVFLGTAEQEAGRVAEARAAYRKYLELAPAGRFAADIKAILGGL